MNLLLVKLLLLSLIFFSALACVSVAFESRELATDLMRLKLAEQELTTRWGQLLLEESALGALPRVEVEAERLASMRAPQPADLVVLQP